MDDKQHETMYSTDGNSQFFHSYFFPFYILYYKIFSQRFVYVSILRCTFCSSRNRKTPHSDNIFLKHEKAHQKMSPEN